MTMNPRDLDHLEARIKDWGRRPAATPASTAARRVVPQLAGNVTPRRPWLRRSAFAAAAASAGLALWFALDQSTRPSPPPASVDLPQQLPGDVAPLPANVVQFWLDPDTPVYFVTGPMEPVRKGLP